ncbi:MAG: hypothetical protein B9S32_09910 [Verrucomicrobia bacterium Tous-C9LFEB]|nr:MAG: hypothetical protein B9S32_09910 [Verrucomicrobia bacterium Tous-C9LFEB]
MCHVYAVLGAFLLALDLASVQAEPIDIFPDALHRLEVLSPGPEAAETRIVPVEGQDFEQALEAKTIQGTQWPWGIQFMASVPVEVRNGDVILAEFSLRTIAATAESGEGKTQLSFEEKGGGFLKSLTYDACAGQAWKRFQIPFRVIGVKGKDYAPNEAQIGFRLGYRGQTIQIGGIRIVNYGQDYDISSLPVTRLDYSGRDSKAAWRAAAQRRIAELRQAPLIVQIVDAAGKPVSGATVDVRMKRHAFRFGSAVDLQFFSGNAPDNQRYRQFVLDHFNQITPENDLKWDYWEANVSRREETVEALKDLKKSGIRIHGHNLIWPGFGVMPRDIKSLLADRTALDKRIADHFTEILGQTHDLVEEWDAVNEPYAVRPILERYGDGLVGDWFALAHRIDPAPVLYLNDYANFQNNGDDTAHKLDFEKRLKDLLAAKAPVQGIGMQGHLGGMVCSPEAVLKELDRFAKIGLPIQITEFDIDATDEKLKADFTRDFMTACFSHPAVIGFSSWGFWEGRHYLPAAAMVRQDWSFTPWGKAWFDLVEKTWWTKASGTSDAAGKYQVNGFLGDYTITVKFGGKEAVVSTALQKGSPVLQIQLEHGPVAK